MEVYVVMQWKGEDKHPEFQGVFDSQKKAEDACRTDDYFVWATKMNLELPDEMVEKGPDYTWYPKLQDRGCPIRRST